LSRMRPQGDNSLDTQSFPENIPEHQPAGMADHSFIPSPHLRPLKSATGRTMVLATKVCA
jgi:hypothetical protein